MVKTKEVNLFFRSNWICLRHPSPGDWAQRHVRRRQHCNGWHGHGGPWWWGLAQVGSWSNQFFPFQREPGSFLPKCVHLRYFNYRLYLVFNSMYTNYTWNANLDYTGKMSLDNDLTLTLPVTRPTSWEVPLDFLPLLVATHFIKLKTTEDSVDTTEGLHIMGSGDTVPAGSIPGNFWELNGKSQHEN